MKWDMICPKEGEYRLEQADRLRRQHVERARYEADLARQRFMQVHPDNRMVADSLEADWNDKLRSLTEAQQEYERGRQQDRATLNEQQRQEVKQAALRLGNNIVGLLLQLPLL